MHAEVLGLLLGVSLVIQFLTWQQINQEDDSDKVSQFGPHTLSRVIFGTPPPNTASKQIAARDSVYPVVTKQLTQIPVPNGWLWFNGKAPQRTYMQIFLNHNVSGTLRMVLKKTKTDETISDMSVPVRVAWVRTTRRQGMYKHHYYEHAIVVQLPVLPPYSGVGAPPNNTYQALDLYLSIDSGTMELHSLTTSHDPLISS
jgi:hypothetical protein